MMMIRSCELEGFKFNITSSCHTLRLENRLSGQPLGSPAPPAVCTYQRSTPLVDEQPPRVLVLQLPEGCQYSHPVGGRLLAPASAGPPWRAPLFRQPPLAPFKFPGGSRLIDARKTSFALTVTVSHTPPSSTCVRGLPTPLVVFPPQPTHTSQYVTITIPAV
ncbi:hypothetical protein BD779DRAFT_591802 [Infundibulicybe gibba]|nr:hypothetical protein BD779DRAFT_591802 [Infundibulicybe gibba]